MFGGLTHEPAVELCRRLVAITPAGLEKVFISDSGSVSVEVAMKMAIQYFHAQGQSHKNRFLTIRSGYHGDTFHAMSVCDPETGMHSLYQGILPQYFFAKRPEIPFGAAWDQSDLESIEQLLSDNHQQICAVILEPIVQGAGGMRFYHPRYLEEVARLCKKQKILLIADEIATGFGRSGELFACNHAGISPDILCLGKALTGGYMTLAATLTTEQVAAGICAAEPGVFMHGPTFMANPLACRLACESIDLLLESDWQEKVQTIATGLREGLEPCREFPEVKEVRVLGAIGVVELQAPVDLATMQKRFVAEGVWVRPFGRLVYVMPPYIIEEKELRRLTRAICKILSPEDEG
jgi:adenosylmethionine-8-amino-7-oxononanoate aminotransferase